MLRFVLRQSGVLALGILGALAMASAIAALSVPAASGGPGAFLLAAADKALAFLRLDIGESAVSGLPAAQELGRHGPATAGLVGLGALFATATGIPLGLLLGAGPMRRVTAPVIQIVSAAPVFVACLALAYVAQHLLGWPAGEGQFPTLARLSHADADALRIVIPPALAVGLAGSAAIQLALRRAAIGTQDQPFRLGLRRLGLSALEIERVYVLPMVFAGLFENLGEVILALLSAALVAEWVFRVPGIADLFAKSIALHDWNMAGLILFLFAAFALLVSFAGRLIGRALTNVWSEA